MKINLKLIRKPEDYGRVAVLLGGSSAEREVSLRSGNAVFNALTKQNINTIKIDPVSNLFEQLKDNNVDRVFNILHGRDGEDGVIQGFLKMLGIPFTGSDVTSSAVAMNKLLCKQIWQQMNIATANFSAVNREDKFTQEDAKNIFEKQGNILFVKPVKEGSSVGMSKVKTINELIEAVNLAHQYDETALIESFIDGEEYTVSIIKGQALPSISMRTPREFYDYEAKYNATTTEYFCPSGLTKEEEEKLSEIALSAFKSIGCSGWGRVDFIRAKNSEFQILEVNTVPGMTESSLVPKAAKSLDISFEELVLHILDTSFDNFTSVACHGEVNH